MTNGVISNLVYFAGSVHPCYTVLTLFVSCVAKGGAGVRRGLSICFLPGDLIWLLLIPVCLYYSASLARRDYFELHVEQSADAIHLSASGVAIGYAEGHPAVAAIPVSVICADDGLCFTPDIAGKVIEGGETFSLESVKILYRGECVADWSTPSALREHLNLQRWRVIETENTLELVLRDDLPFSFFRKDIITIPAEKIERSLLRKMGATWFQQQDRSVRRTQLVTLALLLAAWAVWRFWVRRDQTQYRKPHFSRAQAGVLFVALLFPALLNGWPIVMLDAHRYFPVAREFGPVFKETAPAVPVFFFRPVVTILGAWGQVAIQSALAAVLLAMLFAHLRRPRLFWVYVAFTFFSGISFLSSALMMDIFTLTGLAAILLLLNGYGGIFLLFAVVVSTAAHPANSGIFVLAVAVYTFLAYVSAWRRRHMTAYPRRSLAAIGACIVLSVLFAKSYLQEYQTPYFSCRQLLFTKIVPMGEREGYRTYCSVFPESPLAAAADELDADIPESYYPSPCWHVSFYDQPALRENVGDVWAYTWHLVRRRPLVLARNTFSTYWDFIARPCVDGIDGVAPPSMIQDALVRAVPAFERELKTSDNLQRRDCLHRVAPVRKMKFLLGAAAVLVLILTPLQLVSGFPRSRRVADLTIFAAAAVLANSSVFGMLACNQGRYQARVGFFALCAVALLLYELGRLLRGSPYVSVSHSPRIQ